MGANQSTNDSTNDRDGRQMRSETSKTCYYDLLGIERQSTDEDIKKAYRKKALELHPDRNYGNVENATKLFAEIQAAHEVLSDPQERAWYDSHRDAILREHDEGDSEHYEHNVRITTADEIMRMFTRFDSRVDFSDSPTGYFGTLRHTFSSLASEEGAACDWEGLPVLDYPGFGNANDSYELIVKPFYIAWIRFVTNKTFAWKDIYRYSEAPDRRVRRLMEKENKRRRDEAIKEFNDAVRSLVLFVRKRDPRYTPNTQTEAERQRILRDAAAAQAMRSRASNRAKVEEYIVPEWSKVREPDLAEDESQESEVEEQHYECIVCRKIFKSEKQFETHERSRKHLKEVQLLQKRMHKESVALNLNSGIQGDAKIIDELDVDHSKGDDDSLTRLSEDTNRGSTGGEDIDTEFSNIQIAQSPNAANAPGSSFPRHASSSNTSGSDGSDNDYAPRVKVEERIMDEANIPPIPKTHFVTVPSLSEHVAADPLVKDAQENQQKAKLGKAKEKRAKRAAQQKSGDQVELQFSCATCEAAFPSKTRLFSHIKDFSHAHPVRKVGKGEHGRNR